MADLGVYFVYNSPNRFGGWAAGPLARAALCFFGSGLMVLNVYVDAFNLYYGCLKETEYKWLNLRAFCEASFPADQISRIRYFTARIPANPHDPDKPERQATYFRALQTEPAISIHEGQYLTKIVRMPQHPIPAPPTPPTLVKVVKTEEKGSDVNLATHLLVDAADNDFEGTVVVTNDSDLVLPIQFVRAKFKRRVFCAPSLYTAGSKTEYRTPDCRWAAIRQAITHRPRIVAGREPISGSADRCHREFSQAVSVVRVVGK